MVGPAHGTEVSIHLHLVEEVALRQWGEDAAERYDHRQVQDPFDAVLEPYDVTMTIKGGVPPQRPSVYRHYFWELAVRHVDRGGRFFVPSTRPLQCSGELLRLPSGQAQGRLLRSE